MKGVHANTCLVSESDQVAILHANTCHVSESYQVTILIYSRYISDKDYASTLVGFVNDFRSVPILHMICNNKVFNEVG